VGIRSRVGCAYGLGSRFNPERYDDLAGRPPYKHFNAYRDHWTLPAPTREKAKPGYSSAGALAMARAQKQLAEENGDADLMAHAIELERRALEAIKLGLSQLPEIEKPAT
jgi:hypothetical protein